MNSKLCEQILQYENLLLKPDSAGGINEVVSLIADEFIEYGSSGRVYNKADVVEALKSPARADYAIEDFSIKEFSEDVILAIYTAVKSIDGVVEKSYSLRSSIWKRNHGKWQIVFHQGTVKK